MQKSIILFGKKIYIFLKFNAKSIMGQLIFIKKFRK
jgi:hypothetical protein